MSNLLIILLVVFIAVLTVASKAKADREKCETRNNREAELQKLEVVRFNTRARLINQIEAGKLDRAESNLRKLQMLGDKEEELLV